MTFNMSETQSMSSYFQVNGYPIWYEIFGTGSKPVLMIPGAIGTGRTDFWPQLYGEECLDMTKFTFIAVEAPGWGRSRPPARKFCKDHYYVDAECYHEVMTNLGYNKYSIIGWSDGAKVALLMAIEYRQSIESVVVTALSTYIPESSARFFMTTKNIEEWSEEKIGCYLRSYETKAEIQELWTKFVKYIEYYNQYYPQDIYKDKYHLIKCPLLVLHGDRDQMIDIGQPSNVCKRVKNATLHRFPAGGHDLHLKYTTTFKKLAEQHLLLS